MYLQFINFRGWIYWLENIFSFTKIDETLVLILCKSFAIKCNFFHSFVGQNHSKTFWQRRIKEEVWTLEKSKFKVAMKQNETKIVCTSVYLLVVAAKINLQNLNSWICSSDPAVTIHIMLQIAKLISKLRNSFGNPPL